MKLRNYSSVVSAGISLDGSVQCSIFLILRCGITFGFVLYSESNPTESE